MLTIVAVTILNTSVVEGNNFLTNFKAYDLIKMLPQPESLFYMFCVQIKENVMFVIAEQGRFNIFVYRSRKV